MNRHSGHQIAQLQKTGCIEAATAAAGSSDLMRTVLLADG